jgi:hypothetical protein
MLFGKHAVAVHVDLHKAGQNRADLDGMFGVCRVRANAGGLVSQSPLGVQR